MLMKRRSAFVLFVTALIAVSSALWAAKPDVPTINGFPSLFYTDAALQQYYPVATGTPLPVAINGSIGPVTVEASPSLPVNVVGTLTIEPPHLVSPNQADTEVLTITTETQIVPLTDRSKLIIKCLGDDAELWVNVGGATCTVGVGLLVVDNLELDLSDDVDVTVNASTSTPIAVVQTGY